MALHWLKSEHSIEINTTLNTYAYLRGQKIERVVIALHGFGDNAENASQMATPFHLMNTLFLFIEGPKRITMPFSAFQWFDLFHESHEQIESSAALVLGLFNHLVEDHKIPSQKIYFMGFSQGAAMAMFCGLTAKRKIGGIISLSGFLLHCGHLLSIQQTLDKECRILLLHGDEDQTIFPILFFEAQEILAYLGFKNVQAKLYKLGHNVNPEEINEVKKFLTQKDSLDI